MSEWDFGDIDGLTGDSNNNNNSNNNNDIDDILSGKKNVYEETVSGIDNIF